MIQDKLDNNATYISLNTKCTGNISVSTDIYINGIFEGLDIISDGMLYVGKNASVVVDKIEVADCDFFGVVRGNVHATGRVFLRSGSQFLGVLIAQQLHIESGSEFNFLNSQKKGQEP